MKPPLFTRLREWARIDFNSTAILFGIGFMLGVGYLAYDAGCVWLTACMVVGSLASLFLLGPAPKP